MLLAASSVRGGIPRPPLRQNSTRRILHTNSRCGWKSNSRPGKGAGHTFNILLLEKFIVGVSPLAGHTWPSFRVAACMTVHGVQGLSFERVAVWIPSIGFFVQGQGYIAVSKGKTLGGLFLVLPNGVLGDREEAKEPSTPSMRFATERRLPSLLLFGQGVLRTPRCGIATIFTPNRLDHVLA